MTQGFPALRPLGRDGGNSHAFQEVKTPVERLHIGADGKNPKPSPSLIRIKQALPA
ncbi:hypothetical protein [Azotobacter salinestris]|uniref:hypothetical protein n=1 Tax=Azotobacter salinestris TaxID=69964 RepID=UPI00142F1500|nr:hypothetical protein [Azotobacter salinestris]